MRLRSVAVKVSVITGVLTVFGASAAAFAGTLPDHAQDVVHAAAGHVGVYVPAGTPDDHASDRAKAIHSEDLTTTTTSEVSSGSGTTVPEAPTTSTTEDKPKLDDGVLPETVAPPVTTSTAVDDHRQKGKTPATGVTAAPKVEDRGVNQNRGGRSETSTSTTAPSAVTPGATTSTTVDDHGGADRSGKSGNSGKNGKSDD